MLRFLGLLLLLTNVLEAQQFGQYLSGRKDTLEQAFALEVLSNGNIALGGRAEQGPGTSPGAWVEVRNPQGLTLWEQQILSGNTALQVADIQKDVNGNLLVLAHTPALMEDPSQSFTVLFTLDAITGGLINSKRLSGAASQFSEITLLSDGYLLSGRVDLMGNNPARPAVLKLNNQLDIQWQHVLSGPEVPAGVLYGAVVDEQGFIYVVGSVEGSNWDGLLMRLAPNGAFICKKLRTPANDYLKRIVRTTEGHFILSGNTKYLGSGYERLWLVDLAANLLQIRASWSFGLANQNNDLLLGDMLLTGGDQPLLSTAFSNTLGAPALLMRFSTGNEVVQLQNMAPAALNAGFERLKMLPGQKGIAAAGSWTSQFGDDAFFTQMKPDLSLDTDCCPRSENGDARINMLPGLMLETIVPSSAQPLLMVPWSPELVEGNTPISSVCIPIDLNFSLSSDTICAGESITINALGNTPGVNYQYIYSNAVPDPLNNNQLIFNQAGSITRIGENTFCKVQATRFVQISTQAARFPNTFTPNQDGTNDVFQPKFFCPGSVQSLTIYNRWGNQVYSGDQAWDGKEAPSDVYYYIIVYRQAGVDTDLRASGQLTLLR